MLSPRGRLQTIEAVMKDLCLKLGETGATHLHGNGDNTARRRALLKLTIKALQQLDTETAALSLELPGSDSDGEEVEAMVVGMSNHLTTQTDHKVR